jgi:hypothetical protein
VIFGAGRRWLHATGDNFFRMAVKPYGPGSLKRFLSGPHSLKNIFVLSKPLALYEGFNFSQKAPYAMSCLTGAVNAISRGWYHLPAHLALGLVRGWLDVQDNP